MRKVPLTFSTSWIADSVIVAFIAAFIYGLTIFGSQWETRYNPTYEISLSFAALPIYALFSALRGLIAYGVSLAFTLAVGYWAAKSTKAERIILPFLDIMQSIPVLGFLPGLVLGLVALFPHTNVGLELASIIMIFTGQVWNMAFAFYSSLKSVPNDLREASAVMEFTPLQRLKLLELPYSAMNLTWNSVMSMAGGWFFLTVCEAFTLGDRQYRLPGLGAYMAVAIESGSAKSITAGILTMALVIILFDILLWQPALAWAHKFRLEDNASQKMDEPLVKLLVRGSLLVKFFRNFRLKNRRTKNSDAERGFSWPAEWRLKKMTLTPLQSRIAFYCVVVTATAVCAFALIRLAEILASLSLVDWLSVLRDTALTLARVFGALILGTLWATPAAIWIAQDQKRLRIAQPIVQLMASFPAPMLYPLAMAVFLYLNITFEISSMLLMLLGVQWYILFNVLAGALRVPSELGLSMNLIGSSKRDRWRYLFLPSVLPSLVTGWVTAAGGAWNASIVSEFISYKGQTLRAHGLGAQISEAAEHGNFPRLAACLLVMVIVVVVLNRTLWARLYRLAQIRYRMDL